VIMYIFWELLHNRVGATHVEIIKKNFPDSGKAY
jgi:hypothetical protein